MYNWARFFLVLLVAACAGRMDDLGEYYFDVLDLDKDGSANHTEVQILVQSVLFLSGLGDIRLDDPEKNVNGDTLRQVVNTAFSKLDTSGDDRIEYEEAIAGQEALTNLIGDFMAHNLPQSEF